MSRLHPWQGLVFWLTGPPATGKSTLAQGLLECFHQQGLVTLWLDSDDLRTAFTPHPTYSSEERDVFYGSIGHVAIRAAEGGVTVVISATASKRKFRDDVRESVERFVEVELEASPETLRQRDIKGLYQKADAGEIAELPGVGTRYESAVAPELVLNSQRNQPDVLVNEVLAWLEERWSIA
ncbi:MAG: adenylyl-sulfate kinase [Deltaproteobacteria bacterium]|nr:MAG: adenylyl-sulfate kinase [Deltaproteobacteria bacterium]